MFLKRLSILVLVGLSIPLFLFAQNDGRYGDRPYDDKMSLRKPKQSVKSEVKRNPYQSELDVLNGEYKPNTRSSNFNKLLVLLVDFQLEEIDNPLTTGNGKFRLEPDPDYPITIGSPPYDFEFFTAQLEALKYYYRAVSFESFQLDYDIYPKTKPAYTLSQEMAYYYNPTSSVPFIRQMEAYFQEIFSIVDNDTDRPVAFSDYGHFMVIHAGSDYQNDVFGDTPHDIPSFFINFGTDKEPIVDGGYRIPNTAHVPEHVWQDIRVREYEDVDKNGNPYTFKLYRGYGVVNSVFAHEFGHSLGFADLYNTINGYPGVGVFDIMDSGGSGILADDDDEGNLYYIEGIAPTLPSVFSRLLAFEDTFLSQGILVDISESEMGNTLDILASSAIREIGETTPYFYRIKLSEDEHILIENRSVDPDGDGGTSFVGALGTPGNRRVMLYPSPYGDSVDFTFEYDYLLPSWFDVDDNVIGGGLLIWHVDYHRIFKETLVLNGQSGSYYDHNVISVTTGGKKGVTLLEADNLFDIGNVYAYFWTGTPYEYYFPYAPILDDKGYFVDWNLSKPHNSELSYSSKPQLKTHIGNPSNWKITDISPANRTMTFKVMNNMFDYAAGMGKFNELYFISDEAYLHFDTMKQLAIVSDQGLGYYYQDDVTFAWRPDEEFPNITKPDFPIVTTNLRGDLNEYLLVYDDMIVIHNLVDWQFDSKITQTPLYFTRNEVHYLAIVTENNAEVYVINPELLVLIPLASKGNTGKFAFDGEILYLKTDSNLYKLGGFPQEQIFVNIGEIPEPTIDFDPVIYKHNDKTIIFNMSADHKIYITQNDQTEILLDLKLYTDEIPSQMAVGYVDYSASCFLAVHTSSQVFVISEDGSFYPGFPLRLTNKSLKPYSHPFILSINDETIMMFYDDLQGLLAVDMSGKVRYEYSQYWNMDDHDVKFLFTEYEAIKYLNMIYVDKDKNIFSAVRISSESDELIWNGYRNGGTSVVNRTREPIINPISSKIEVFVYPNPIRQEFANVKILNTSSKAELKIYNISGQLVYNQLTDETIENFRDIMLNTKKLSSGMYFVNVLVDGKTYSTKFAVVK